MQLWTVQPLAVWEAARENGSVRVDALRANSMGWTHPRYHWLAWQLGDRLREYVGSRPWFAYCERPDLRWVRHSRPAGSREVLLELEVVREHLGDAPKDVDEECTRLLALLQ